MTASRIPRPTARVLVLDEDDRVLLILAPDGEYRGSGQPVWLTPGGGVDEGETYEDAALRELREEVGLEDVALGPCDGGASCRFRSQTVSRGRSTSATSAAACPTSR